MAETGSARGKVYYAGIAFVVLSLIWGYNWVVMKEVLKYAGPFDFAALRTVLGAAALFTVLLLQRKPLKPVALKTTFFFGLLQTTAFMALTQWALVSGGAGKTAVLSYTMPFWVLLLAWPLLNERIRGWQWIAVALAAGGLLLILEPWNMQGTVASSLMAVTAGLAWGASTIVAKRLRDRVRVDLLSLTAWQMLLGSLVLVAIALLVPSEPILFTPYFIGALIYNAIFATAIAWVLWLFVLETLPAGMAGLGMLIVPATGVLAAWIELGETPSRAELAGMLLIAVALVVLCALAWIEARRLRSPRPAQAALQSQEAAKPARGTV
ncbi:MAG TPA: DMT family transporter [Burkholderiales bacterium]|nr:DMT family transporter [Burkholderiales bacterium]